MLLVAAFGSPDGSRSGAMGAVLPAMVLPRRGHFYSKESRAAHLQQCVSRWVTNPRATALFEGSCGTNNTWTAGGEGIYCPDVQSDGNACEEDQCDPFNTGPQDRHRQWLGNITTKAQTAQRHAELSTWLDARQQPDGPVLLMSANAGYMYLVENWVRHAVQRGLNLSEATMILTDDESAKAVKRLGFRAVSTRLFRADILFASATEETTASPVFAAAASHAGTNAMALVAITDLLRLGVDVLWSDADVVFNASPLPWLSDQQPYVKCAGFSFREDEKELRAKVAQHWPEVLCFNHTAKLDGHSLRVEPDIQMMDDSRWDSAGPGNSGFSYFRSNCRTLDLSRAILASLYVQLGSASDQRFLMRLLHGPSLRDVSMALLPVSRFINGATILGISKGSWQRQSGYVNGNDEGFPSPQWVAGHASWTASHEDKPALLEKLGAWHMNDTVGTPAGNWSELDNGRWTKSTSAKLLKRLVARHAAARARRHGGGGGVL